MLWRRTSTAGLVGVLVLAVLAGCGATPAPEAPPAPLRILLVNANGWTSPGVLILRDALRRAGHTVVQVSPLADTSSSGTAVTMPPTPFIAGPLPGDPALWGVSGTAADAAQFGLHGVLGNSPPDLVISGIDSRPNVSLDTMRSGTVGAALVAAGLNVPSVAVSVDLPTDLRANPASFVPSASFVVQLVGALSRRSQGVPLMSDHTVLNVNYPGGAARAVVSAKTADNSATRVYYRTGARPGEVVAVPQVEAPTGARDDVNALAQGDVTLTDLSADPDRTQPPPRTAARLAPLLHP